MNAHQENGIQDYNLTVRTRRKAVFYTAFFALFCSVSWIVLEHYDKPSLRLFLLFLDIVVFYFIFQRSCFYDEAMSARLGNDTLTLHSKNFEAEVELRRIETFFVDKARRLHIHLEHSRIQLGDSRSEGQDVYALEKALHERLEAGSYFGEESGRFSNKVEQSRQVENRKGHVTFWFLALLSASFFLQGIVEEYFKVELSAVFGNLHAGIDEGQYYRLLTYSLLHASNVHFFFNAAGLFLIGFRLEKVIGAPNFLLLTLCSVVSGGLVSYAYDWGATPSVGASAAVYGYIAGFIASKMYLKAFISKAYFFSDSLWPIVLASDILFMQLSDTSTVDWPGHIGGALGGFVLVYFLGASKQLEKSQAKKNPAGAGV